MEHVRSFHGLFNCFKVPMYYHVVFVTNEAGSQILCK